MVHAWLLVVLRANTISVIHEEIDTAGDGDVGGEVLGSSK